MCVSLTTTLLLLLVLPTLVLSKGQHSQICDKVTVPDSCTCRFVTRESKRVCCCFGISRLPDNLSNETRKLVLWNTKLEAITRDTFEGFTALEQLEIDTAPLLSTFDAYSLHHTSNLSDVSISYAPLLTSINGSFLDNHFRIRRIDIHHTGLQEMPILRMSPNHELTVEIDLSNNRIKKIPRGRVEDIKALSLILSYNNIERIDEQAFRGSSIHNLDLSVNPQLSSLHEDAFTNMVVLDNLDLSRSSISSLPVEGMERVKVLHLKKVMTLKQLPPVTSFSSLINAAFTYPYHCCLFKHLTKAEIMEHSRLMKERRCRKMSELIRRVKRQMDWADGFAENFDYLEEQNATDYGGDEMPAFEDDEIGFAKCLEEEVSVRDNFDDIVCTPQPDALNPCENIIGIPAQRYSISLIWVLSIIFNIIVWVMLYRNYKSRLLSHYIFMFNLSLADAITAVYIGILVIADQYTADGYFRYAVEWQEGKGCGTAGFIAVFSSSLSALSMFSVAMDIAYSMRRAEAGRHLPIAVCIVCVLFTYLTSFTLASLPFFGVSSYSKTSTCLPLYIGDAKDEMYALLCLFVVVFSFVGMFVSFLLSFDHLRDKTNPYRAEYDHMIFKTEMMALTDLVCWTPSSLLGFAATLGYPLISISAAKIFILSFFAVNSLTHPLLYVVLTKRFQRQVEKNAVIMLQRLAATHNAVNSFARIPISKARRIRRSMARRYSESNEPEVDGMTEEEHEAKELLEIYATVPKGPISELRSTMSAAKLFENTSLNAQHDTENANAFTPLLDLPENSQSRRELAKPGTVSFCI